LRNTLRKNDLQDTAPGILIFSNLMNLKLVQQYSCKKARSFIILAVRDRVNKKFLLFKGADYADSPETGKDSKSDEKGNLNTNMLIFIIQKEK
jgi:hypothetical protein